MRKSRILLLLSILCVLVVAATALFACGKTSPSDLSKGRVVSVASAMDTIYAAMVASDGSVESNYFTLRTQGTYLSGEDLYYVSFGGTFDITQSNRADDKRSQLYLEVKKGDIELFLLYYSDGKVYLDFSPYARRGVISDFNLASTVYEIISEKNDGVIKRAVDTIPLIGSRIFTNCRCYTSDEGDRYEFTLSYERLFDAFGSIVDSWKAGFSASELLSALKLTEADRTALVASTGQTTVRFLIKDGAFRSASAEAEGKGAITIDSFALTRGSDDVELPSVLSTFTEYDLRNFSLSGTMNLHASTGGKRTANYDITLDRTYEGVTYTFTYDFKSHYVVGSGLEFSLSLVDKNGKASAFNVRGDYLYIDLSDYGIAKCKIATEELSSRLGKTGFKDVGEYDFRDKLRLFVLLAAARSEEGSNVTYTLGKDFFDLLSEKIGFKGLFGVDGAEISWDTSNNRLRELAASLTIGDMTASLSAATFTFGTPVSLSEIADSEYTDLAAKEKVRISLSGTIRENTSFSSVGDLLSTLLSSLSGESVGSFSFTGATGAVSYNVDLVFGATGAIETFYARLNNDRGREIVELYYANDETKTDKTLYLIYPADSTTGVRPLRALTLKKEHLLSAFNDALAASDSAVGRTILLGAYEDAFMVGMHSPMLNVIAEKIALIYHDFALPCLSDLKCRRYELRMTKDTLTGKVVFDDANDLVITATSWKVRYGEDVKIVSVTANTPTAVSFFADNDMPTYATVTFPTDIRTSPYKVSLIDYKTGEKIWSYTNAPTTISNASAIVTATAAPLGYSLEASITVDRSSPQAVSLSNSATHADRYYDGAFHMDYYNDDSHEDVIGSFEWLTVTTQDGEYVKKNEWDYAAIKKYFGEEDLTVKLRVRSYFGDLITLGKSFEIPLIVNGSVAVSVPIEYNEITFVAYDGRDPLDEAVYSDVVVVQTDSGDLVEVRNVKWNVSNSDIKEKKGDTLYAYSGYQTVQVYVYDSAGNPSVQDVTVRFVGKEVDSVEFDCSGLKGVSYTKSTSGEEYLGTFTFDILYVRGLSVTDTAKVLPNSASANGGAWEINGIKWTFEEVESVLNAVGKTGILTFQIGDDISGYQNKTFRYVFTTPIDIKNVTLRDAEHNAISQANVVDDGFEVVRENLNAYTYQFPKYVYVEYETESGMGNEEILVDWIYDRPYIEENLCDGGDYELSCAVGSATLTVRLSFDQQIITNYRFGDEDAVETMKKADVLNVHNGKTCLYFKVIDALNTDGKKYTDVSEYPSTLEFAFNGGSEYVSVPVSWDLSAYKGKDLLGEGFFGTVSVIAKGQTCDEVYVYILPAYEGNVYTNTALTEQSLTFSLMSVGDIISSGVYRLNVTDPRDVKNYHLYVAGEESPYVELEGVEWLDLDQIVELYESEKDKTAPNKISGTRYVRAKIGNSDVGYKEIQIPVNIVESEIDEGAIEVKGIPFAASSEMMGGTTLTAVEQTAEAPSIDGEDCRFTLEINPYYVNPKAQTTYPAWLEFTLDGYKVRASATWDLTSIPLNAAEETTDKTYLVWAEISIASYLNKSADTLGIKDVRIPVAVKVLKREIESVWITGSDGLESSAKYIDIDGYSYNAFGEMKGGYAYLDVKVQFKKDANRYPLKLRYDPKDIVLRYDGGGVGYSNITVYVGNESGGYRARAGYTIRILAKRVTKVKIPSTGKTFYEAEETDGILSYKDSDDDSVVVENLPTTIKVVFNFAGDEKAIDVPLATGNDEDKGIVFRWCRQGTRLGIELSNPSVAEKGEGMRQAVYDKKQNDYAMPTVGMFFTDNGENAFVSELTYRDKEDGKEPYTVSSLLEEKDGEILISRIEKTYQVRYITTDADDAEPLEGALSAGTYRLYVSVVGHEQYKGEVYRIFTILPKPIAKSYVKTKVDGSLYDPAHTYIFKGKDYTVSATTVSAYPIDIALRIVVDETEVSSCSLQDVRYSDDNKEVIAYEFAVVSANPNYEIEKGTKISFKITESSDVPSPSAFSAIWQVDHLVVSLSVNDEELILDPGENLTKGYKIYYYDGDNTAIDASAMTAGNTYYYTIEYKIPNYESGYIGVNPRMELHT